MSTTAHPNSYYQHNDITDPTPYEDDDVILDGSVCMICGEEFHQGEPYVRIEHFFMAHDRFLVHDECLRAHFKTKSRRETFEEVLETLGFEIGEDNDY